MPLRSAADSESKMAAVAADKESSLRKMPSSSRVVSTATQRDGSQDEGTGPSFTIGKRQSSFAATKSPLGPRSMDILGNKRSASNSVVQGTSAVASQDPYTHQLSINEISRFSFASITPQRPTRHESKDSIPEFGGYLEPQFNFDDFHDHITTTGPTLNQFPLPSSVTKNNLSDPAPAEQKKAPTQPAIPVLSRKLSGAGSVSRKGSTASNAGRMSNRSEPMSTTATTIRARRQSHFPPNAFNNAPTAPKAPRKSVGPGTFIAPDQSGGVSINRRPSLGVRKSSSDGRTIRITNKKTDESFADESNPTRNVKAKSILVPSRKSSRDLLTPARTPDPLSGLTGNANTPSKKSATNTNANVPTNRRISVMPSHLATGLGARTVSPTDARRARRMSNAPPPAPPLPTNLTPQSEHMPPMPTSFPQSPQDVRTSLTPSSARTTPDPNRKSYSSGQSLSSSTSFNSAANPGHSAPMTIRIPQPAINSRLPAPKPRLDNNGEEVPPVPAIPKAYESPGSEMEQPFFSARNSSLQPSDTPISASPNTTTIAEAMKKLESGRAPSSASHLSTVAVPELDVRMNPVPKVVKKKSGPTLRLPPLNLLPIGTPTSFKIKSLKNDQSDAMDIPSTPPSGRNNVKTPGTPMTASKATFFSRNARAMEDNANIPRSNTSHFALRLGESNVSPSLPSFAFEGDNQSGRSISPFISSSLPKQNGEYPAPMRPDFSAPLNRPITHSRPNGPRAPSFSITPKAADSGSSAQTPVVAESMKADSSIANPASLTKLDFKLDEVKDEFNAWMYDNMPPPKIPASATWANLAEKSSKSSSPVQKPAYLKSRRKISSSNVVPRFDSQDSTTSQHSGLGVTKTHTLQPSRSNTLLNNIQNSPKSLTQQTRSQEPGLDRDDTIAEDEMKKLATKRRDFEVAARELDELTARARPSNRMSATTASHLHEINIYERGEIVDFPDIYFSGAHNARKIVGDSTNGTNNMGFDDERGDYNIVEGDHLAYRYEVVDLLGKGSFGQVVRCVDHKTGRLVAVKIIRNKKRFHQQALVEVNILQKLRDWDPEKKHSVVSFDQSFYFRGHLCISTDLLSMNLYEFIKAHDFRGFSLKLIRRFTKQMLSTLALLHSKKVIHCDLKPENVLLVHPAQSGIKVIDFGSSCFENEKVYTYIQSRFYRSPEVILGMSYGMPIDMWSLGCILAELYTGYPIFPGENEQEQLACIMEVFGPPEKHLIEKSTRKKLFFDSMGKPRLTVSSKGRRRRPSSKDLRQVLKCDDEAFLDFLTRCLRWDPSKRLTPLEASKHEFISGVKATPLNNRKHLTTSTNSPIKRVNSITAPGATRPLPQPPSTSLKVAPRQDAMGISPVKIGSRRQSSAVTAVGNAATAKRASHAAAMTASASSSSLSRVTMGQRTTSQRSDLAAAAAQASLIRL